MSVEENVARDQQIEYVAKNATLAWDAAERTLKRRCAAADYTQQQRDTLIATLEAGILASFAGDN